MWLLFPPKNENDPKLMCWQKVEWESGEAGEGECEHQEGDANFKSFKGLLRYILKAQFDFKIQVDFQSSGRF